MGENDRKVKVQTLTAQGPSNNANWTKPFTKHSEVDETYDQFVRKYTRVEWYELDWVPKLDTSFKKPNNPATGHPSADTQVYLEDTAIFSANFEQRIKVTWLGSGKQKDTFEKMDDLMKWSENHRIKIQLELEGAPSLISKYDIRAEWFKGRGFPDNCRMLEAALREVWDTTVCLTHNAKSYHNASSIDVFLTIVFKNADVCNKFRQKVISNAIDIAEVNERLDQDTFLPEGEN